MEHYEASIKKIQDIKPLSSDEIEQFLNNLRYTDQNYSNVYYEYSFKQCKNIILTFQHQITIGVEPWFNVSTINVLSDTLNRFFDNSRAFINRSKVSNSYVEINDKLNSSEFKNDYDAIIKCFNEIVLSYLIFRKHLLVDAEQWDTLSQRVNNTLDFFDNKTKFAETEINSIYELRRGEILTLGNKEYDKINNLAQSAEKDYATYFNQLKSEIFHSQTISQKEEVFTALLWIGGLTIVAVIALLCYITFSIAKTEEIISYAIETYKLREYVYLYIVKKSIPTFALTIILSALLISLIKLFRSYLNIYNSYNHKSFLLSSVSALFEDKALTTDEKSLMLKILMEKLSEFDSSNVAPENKNTDSEILNKLSNLLSILPNQNNKS